MRITRRTSTLAQCPAGSELSDSEALLCVRVLYTPEDRAGLQHAPCRHQLLPLVPGMHTARQANSFNDTLKRDRQTGR